MRYLTCREVADARGVCVRTIQRWADDLSLPVLRIGRALRIEAAIDAEAQALPTPKQALTAEQLASLWRVNPRTIHQLIRGGSLRAIRYGTGAGSRYVVPASAVAAFVNDHSTGPDGDVVLCSVAS